MTCIMKSNFGASSKDHHPLLRHDYAVYTPPMNQMIETIGDWIDRRVTGGYIYGPSRFGKSRAVKFFVRSVLEERFQGRLPLVVWIRHDSQMSEREFWNLLLIASEFHFAKHGVLSPKLKAHFLFKERLITLANDANQNYIILLIDEAHEVRLNEWKWLLGLQNELDNEGFLLSVFSIGSHQLGYQPDFLARIGDAHLVARFFAVDAPFHGISDPEELRFVLKGYDEDSDWPPGSNTSFLCYFSPENFDKNKRISDHSVEMWAAFHELLPPGIKASAKEKIVELPMLHVALLVERILNLLSKGKDWDDVMGRDSLLKIIASTGFSDYMRVIKMS